MSSAPTRCPGCGFEHPAGTGVYEGYYHASPDCWNVFLQVMTREYEDAVLFGQVHQLSVDAYAVQHAGGPHPDKSVCIHLVGLYWTLERGVAPPDVPRRLQALAANVERWPHLELPAQRAALTVAHVADADTPSQHARNVRAWSSEVWASWKEHHAAVAQLAQRTFEAVSSGA